MTENNSDDALFKIRHRFAHVMAQAMSVIQPHATLGFGPPIDNGLFLDFILPTPITEPHSATPNRACARSLGNGCDVRCHR
jgi:threonyl-tRNA synthetase